MQSRLLIAPIVAGALTVLAMGATPESASAQEIPCNVQADRTVEPTVANVGDKVQVDITVTGECDNESKGIDIFFVVDRTPTMFDQSYRPRFIDALQEGLKGFVNAMDFSKSQAGVMSYAARSQVNRNLTDDQDAIIKAIDQIRMTEESDVRGLQAAFRTAVGKLDNDGDPDNQKVVMIFAAGPDTNNDLVNMPTVTQAARNAGVTVVFFQFSTREAGSIYTHFIKASSDCDPKDRKVCVPYRFTAGGPVEYKYAWSVTAVSSPTPGDHDVRTKLRDFSDFLLFGVEILQVDIHEYFNGSVTFEPNSALPPPSSPSSPPYWEANWEFYGMPPDGVTVQYLVTVNDVGSYAVTDASQAVVKFTDGREFPIDLPNPTIEVREAPQDTPTPTATATVVEPTDTPETPTPDTPTPTSTAEDTQESIYLPLTMRSFG
jgi:hypothetical protein